MKMANWYVTRDAGKRAAGIHGSDRDLVVDRAIAASSRYIDRITGRRFVPITQTRSYNWPQRDSRRGYVLSLDEDLLSVSTLTRAGTDLTAIVAADYFLEPINRPPYDRIEIDLAS